jgi:SAM-dependent methyltransferase
MPDLIAYLTTNRNFLAAAVAQAVAALDLPDGGRVLDAGTGAGGALPSLARAVGPGGSVVAIDLNPTTIGMAADYAAQAGLDGRVTLETVDLTDLLTAAGAPSGERFDAIWASDVVWPGNFVDPAATVALFSQALKPGGIVALFYSNYYQATFLPGHPRLERSLRTASELHWKLPAGGPQHHDRHLSWLLAANLHDVTLRVFPRVGFPIDDDPTVRPYLESTVWPELLESAAACGADAGLSRAELDDLHKLLTPGTSQYVADEPGFFIVHPTILATGRRR